MSLILLRIFYHNFAIEKEIQDEYVGLNCKSNGFHYWSKVRPNIRPRYQPSEFHLKYCFLILTILSNKNWNQTKQCIEISANQGIFNWNWSQACFLLGLYPSHYMSSLFLGSSFQHEELTHSNCWLRSNVWTSSVNDPLKIYASKMKMYSIFKPVCLRPPRKSYLVIILSLALVYCMCYTSAAFAINLT